MTIMQMQILLTKMAKKHGNVEVYFDCPKCQTSFIPDQLVGVATHLTQKGNSVK